MADVKVSGLPNKSTPAAADYVVLNDATGPTTKRALLSALASFFFNQTNMPAGATGSPVTRFDEALADFVASGGVLSGDAYASTRNASMTAAVVYINGRRISISAVTARTYTASKDTYVDVLDNGDGTGTLVYTEVTNGAAAPALAANSLRLGTVVTGASNIASAVAGIFQWGLDSLGNFRRNISPSAAPITIYTNPGNAGGTFYYQNQSGVKEFWGITASVTGAAAPTTYTITFPSGYFNQTPAVTAQVAPGNTTNQQNIVGAGGGTDKTQFQINVWASITTSAEPVSITAKGF